MRPSFLFRSTLLLFFWWGSCLAAHASHLLGADLTYAYAGTAALPNQYRVTARLFQDATSLVQNYDIWLTCGKNECGTALAGSFTAFMTRTAEVTVSQNCAGGGSGGSLNYRVTTLEALVQLPPADWTLSINGENRRFGLVNMDLSGMQSMYVKAELHNATGLINFSPQFTTAQLIQLSGLQARSFSLNAYDSDGDSLVYQLVQPLAAPSASPGCSRLTVGSIAPHFQINAATGQLRTGSGLAEQGTYALAVRVDEYRRVSGNWQQIGSITRDMIYLLALTSNQLPAFTRVARSGSPSSQLLGQTIPVSPGQTLALTVSATDADAGQVLALSSQVPAVIPGATFQDLGNGQGLLTWQVPATQPLGRYALTATATDNACPVPGAEVLTVPVVVTRQALAARARRQPLAQPPHPMPFQDEVRFQLAEPGRQAVLITDQLGRTVAQLLSAADGTLVWQPAATVAAGLYLARNLSGAQVARLSYAGR